jgi:hypothetical protein
MNEMSEQQVLEILKNKIKKIDELEEKVRNLEEKAKETPRPKGFFDKLGDVLQADLGENKDE